MNGIKTSQFAGGQNGGLLNDYVINGYEVDAVQQSSGVLNQ